MRFSLLGVAFRAARGANHEGCAKHVVAVDVPALVRERVEELVGSPFPELGDRDMNRSKGWIYVSRYRDIVEPRDGDFFGNVHTTFTKSAKCAYSHGVVCGKHCSGAGAEL